MDDWKRLWKCLLLSVVLICVPAKAVELGEMEPALPASQLEQASENLLEDFLGNGSQEAATPTRPGLLLIGAAAASEANLAPLSPRDTDELAGRYSARRSAEDILFELPRQDLMRMPQAFPEPITLAALATAIGGLGLYIPRRLRGKAGHARRATICSGGRT